MWTSMPRGMTAEDAPEAQLNEIARELLNEFGISPGEIIPSKGETGFTGFTYTNELVIGAPWPVTSLGELFVLAHEVGHVRLHVRRDSNGWYRLADMPRHKLEYEAEQFAISWFERRGLSLPQQVLRDARESVEAGILMEIATGSTDIDPDAAQWVGLSQADVASYQRELEEHGAIARLSELRFDVERCRLGRAPGPWRFQARRLGMMELMVSLFVAGTAVAVWARLS